ncbi:MAG: divalent-cation tolerance protein CutA [Acidobacteriota bacterium]|nr:divalent-cation tolerance protein CutA [Blastocatellia bacterium]MDW8412526.1 divalent-cation tolerance protein CutA [Acidobacteriota bacterium]
MKGELVVFVTIDSEQAAVSMAETLVNERLAACVNIVAVKSVYRWQGNVVKDEEWLLIIKTDEKRYERLESTVKGLHSYTTPEVIALRIEKGSQQYLEWLRDSLEGK